jgi:hypothetical protein
MAKSLPPGVPQVLCLANLVEANPAWQKQLISPNILRTIPLEISSDIPGQSEKQGEYSRRRL